jgi:hypothetical protein
MSRLNPWVVIPVALATVAGGVVGALVTQVSCAPESCVPASIGIGLASAAAAFFGVGVVVVLAVRSMAEWREAERTGRRPPSEPGESGPPTC